MKEKLYLALRQDTRSLSGFSNLCHIQISALPVEIKTNENDFSQQKKSNNPNFGSSLSLKGIEDGTNVPFMSVKEILKFQNDVIGGKLKKPTVSLCIMMLFNNEIYDMLTEHWQRGKIKFVQKTNNIQGSINYGQQFQ